MAMIRKKRSKVTAVRMAVPRAAGLIVFEISHSISSVRTAAEPMVAEKMKADIRLTVGRAPVRGRLKVLSLSVAASPESNGNSFCRTTAETKRKVIRKGSDEKMMVDGAEMPPPGLHSLQSAALANIRARRSYVGRGGRSLLYILSLSI